LVKNSLKIVLTLKTQFEINFNDIFLDILKYKP
jgi:hypothetical protein